MKDIMWAQKLEESTRAAWQSVYWSYIIIVLEKIYDVYVYTRVYADGGRII